ncbi:ATP phosphoribosyltransferase [Allokutzneria multivorans]|uniref:ATP phosphoribosyltransferase n=1 Tax=Allokutzneria multivorans TaxID=1142134 RepID=UPI0031EFEDDB
MLRVAVPNKGSLSAAAVDLLHEAGYRVRRSSRELSLVDPDNGVEFFFQRPRDCAVYVGRGALDVGITGQDLLVDASASVREVLRLGFARSQFRFAAAEDARWSDVTDLAGLRIATSFPVLARKHLADNGVSAELVTLEGAVENAVALGLADVIADVVETGTSLRNAGLLAFGAPLMDSEAVLVVSSVHELPPGKAKIAEVLRRRLQGVLDAHKLVMLDYDCPEEKVSQASRITPGQEGPTISGLDKPGWVAMRALVERADVQRIMDELTEIGATAILATRLEACRI